MPYRVALCLLWAVHPLGHPRAQETPPSPENKSRGPALLLQPSAPLNVLASFAATGNCDLTATVTWTRPTSTGGTGIIGYTVTCDGTPAVAPVTVPAPPATLVLSANQSYICSVVANNAAGSSLSAAAPAIIR